MPSHHIHSRRRRNATSRWSIWLRVLLLVAAWQGPLPWCHRHGTLAESDIARAPQWLVKHLQTHHGSISPLASIFFGWHLHAILPGRTTDDPDQPRRAEEFRLPTAGGADCLTDHLVGPADGLSVSLAEQIASHGQRPAAQDAYAFRWKAHFFDGFAPTLSLPERFGVARC